MKKIALFLLLFTLVMSISSCNESTPVDPITAEEFKTKILEKVAFDGDMIDCTKLVDYPLDTHNIKSDMYSSYVYLEVSDTTNSYETIIVFAATSTENATYIKGKLDDYINNLKAQFSNYNDTIIEMVNKSVVKAKGNNVYLIISPNVSEIEKVVSENIAAFK